MRSASPGLSPESSSRGSSRNKEEAEIRAQLQRIAESPAFRGSKRCRHFLEHVVEHSLAAPDDSLKERLVGVQVFGREPSYDTAADPIVRVTAGEIRRRLGQYYAGPGHKHELRIDLPVGGYTPTYSWPAAEEVAGAYRPAARTGEPRFGIGGLPRFASWRLTRVAAAACLAVAVAFATMLAGPRVGTFDRFWAPVLGSPMPVLICTGSSEFYDLSQRLLDTLEASPNDDSATLSIERSDLQRVGTRFVSLNDALALARVVGLLQKYDKTYQVRENRTASFADLRSSPVVLIGLFSNAWTLRLASDFRFAPAVDAMLRRVYIQDRQHPGQTDWHLKEPWPALAVARDFGLVSRVHDLATGNIVVIAAGITPYGTTAAIDLLTTPQLVEQALHQAPRDWADRNLQIVVETRVAQGTAGPPRVLATHFW